MHATLPDRLPPLPLPDLRGRRAVVTGASAGVGLATATELAGAGASVVLAVRDAHRGAAAGERIRSAHPGASLVVELVELGSLASVAAFAERVATGPVHLLVSNAGLNSTDGSATTVDGFELQVGVNYLGSWALVAGLWPALAGAGGRVVTLGSLVARRGRIGPDLGVPTGQASRAYADSKLAQVVLALELRRRCAAASLPVTAAAAHPGWSRTAIFDSVGPPAWVDTLAGMAGVQQSAGDGAQPVLLAATTTRPGPSYGPTRRGGAVGPPGPVPLPRRAREQGVGEALWQISAERTGVSVPL